MNLSPNCSETRPRDTVPDLASNVRRAREIVHASRRTPVLRADVILAHHALLNALEDYASELADRHLPIPRRLRDDLRLQRRIGRQPE